jgi:hypothetical protein
MRIGHNRRGRRGPPPRWLAVACSVLTTSACVALDTAARADEHDESREPRDYDAADPNRNALTYLRAAAYVPLVSYLIWQYDWLIRKNSIYRVTGPDISRHLHEGLTWDDNPLPPNFIGHPYNGALYFGGARAVGTTFWEAIPFTVAGSIAWKYAGEWGPPNINDIITTSFGGIALGEPLYRIASLVLDDSTSGIARLGRELLGAGVNPTRGLNRVITSEAWADGAPPLRKRSVVAANVGIDQIGAGTVTAARDYAPSALVALEADYGDLLPKGTEKTIPAYDFFDLRASVVIGSEGTTVTGLDLATFGLLYGWSKDLPGRDDHRRDNNVFGFVQSMDYWGSDMLRFAGLGVGVGDMLVVRSAPGIRTRVGLDLEWTPLAAPTTPVVVPASNDPSASRNYNYTMGGSLGLNARGDFGRAGRIGLAAREYVTTTVEGVPGRELIGHTRLWYEVDILPDIVGLGVSPRFVHRRGDYFDRRTYEASQLSVQLYLTTRL